MKTVFEVRECVHMWASQTQEHGRTARANLRFLGTRLYSYGVVIGRVLPVDRHGVQYVLLDERRYSVTTSRHQSYARQAVGHMGRIDVPDASASVLANAHEVANQAKQLLKRLSWPPQKAGNNATVEGMLYEVVVLLDKAQLLHNIHGRIDRAVAMRIGTVLGIISSFCEQTEDNPERGRFFASKKGEAWAAKHIGGLLKEWEARESKKEWAQWRNNLKEMPPGQAFDTLVSSSWWSDPTAHGRVLRAVNKLKKEHGEELVAMQRTIMTTLDGSEYYAKRQLDECVERLKILGAGTQEDEAVVDMVRRRIVAFEVSKAEAAARWTAEVAKEAASYPDLDARMRQLQERSLRLVREQAEQWRAGGAITSRVSVLPVMLRLAVTPNGRVVQTSHGATVPASAAVKLWPVVNKARNGGEEEAEAQTSKLHGTKVGAYTFDKVTSAGTLYISCHVIDYCEFEQLAKEMGLRAYEHEV